jgi:hypothetical protein
MSEFDFVFIEFQNNRIEEGVKALAQERSKWMDR